MKKILIVEDEYSIAMDIETRLIRMGYEVIGIADSFQEALQIVQSDEPDLILMDIHINGDKNGIESAELLTEICNAPLVFLTAYSEDEIFKKALTVKPAGYLLKPFDEKQLKSTIEVGLMIRKDLEDKQKEINRLKSILSKIDQSVVQDNQQVFIRDKYKIVQLNLKEIFRLEALDNYTQIFTAKGKMVVNLYLKDVVSHLKGTNLMRIHKSHVINIESIEYIDGNTVFVNKIEVPIGRKYKQDLMEKLNII